MSLYSLVSRVKSAKLEKRPLSSTKYLQQLKAQINSQVKQNLVAKIYQPIMHKYRLNLNHPLPQDFSHNNLTSEALPPPPKRFRPQTAQIKIKAKEGVQLREEQMRVQLKEKTKNLSISRLQVKKQRTMERKASLTTTEAKGEFTDEQLVTPKEEQPDNAIR